VGTSTCVHKRSLRTPLPYLEDTPIEEYRVKGQRVFVKREDLYGQPPAPPLGKLRGLRLTLENLYQQNVRLVGCWETRISRLAEGVAAACLEFPDMRAIVSYPIRTGVSIPPSILNAQLLGAEVLPLRGNHVSICFAQARAWVEARGGRMLPFGLENRDAVNAVASEARRIPPHLSTGTVVLCCGSGVTLAGLLLGLPLTPKRLIGLSSGRSLLKIRSCVLKYVPEIPPWVRLRAATMPYDAAPAFHCPFPTHPNYDLKAWKMLCARIDDLPQPILFWNIGS
jgi:1-aminocyclopropane-1-carboxylate deaminase/D-cysteine desulfhydrase-like pyridoxal-dependent ACC family enzyme